MKWIIVDDQSGDWILSQLGSYLVPENAKAGKKRIQKLVYSHEWDSSLLEEHLWKTGEERMTAGPYRAAVLAKLAALVVSISWNFFANHAWTFQAETKNRRAGDRPTGVRLPDPGHLQGF